MSPTATAVDYFPLLKSYLMRNNTVVLQALRAVVGFNILRDQMPEGASMDEAFLIPSLLPGSSQPANTRGQIAIAQAEIWCYGANDRDQLQIETSVTLELLLTDALADKKNEVVTGGVIMGAKKNAPASGEFDPDTDRAFQRSVWKIAVSVSKP